MWTRALVTGASSGIGNAIARQLAADGTELVVVARNESRLDGLAESVSVNCEVLPADLSDLDQLGHVEERLAATGDGAIDLLVNNAGFGFVGPFHQRSLSGEAAVVAVNVLVLQRLTHAALSSMVPRGRGGLLNVSSVAGWMPAANSATYAASKAFVTSFSESIHAELKPKGIHVTALCPGFTRTEFQARASYDASGIPRPLWQTPDKVAGAGLAGIAQNRPIVVPGVQNKVGASMFQTLPKAARRFILAKASG